MADPKLEIEVAVATGAAEDALGSLSETMRGFAKATDDAGGEQKTLAKSTAEATQKVQAQRDAVERAKRASAEAAAVTQAFGKDSREAAEAVQRLKTAEEAAAKATREAAGALTNAAKAVSAAANAADDKARPAILRMGDALQKAGRESERSSSDLRTLEARMHSLGSESKRAGGFLEKFKTGAIMGLGASVAQAGLGMLGDGLKAAASFAVETAASYETLKTALETTTGSQEKANAKFAELQKFAAATPFSLEEVTGAYIKLSNRGINANDRLMTSLGNTASAMGKTLDDAVEAMADAVTGENERLKEFGIVGKLAGDQVAYTFRGVTTMVKRDAASIAEYLTKIGESNFAGGMEKQSRTLAGMFSTLQDTAGQFAASLMDAGVSDTLKDIMGEVTNLVGGGSELAKTMGGALASGLRATWEILKDLAPLFMATAKASKWLFDTVSEYLAANDEWAAHVMLFGREVETAHDRLKEYALAHGEALGPIGEMMKATFMSTEAQLGLNAAIRQGQRIREDAARSEALLATLAERRDRETAARLAKLQGEKDARDKAAQMAEFQKLSTDKSLSPSERKRLNELSKTLDIPLPKKPKKPKKDTTAIKEHGFDADVAAFEFGLTKEVRKENAAAAVKAYEDEVAAREKELASIDREIAALDALGEAKAESVDALFFTIEVESEVARAREELIDQQLAAELRLARWQVANAKTEEQREKAQTRLEQAEHARRLESLRRSTEAEAREHAKKQKVVETVTGAVTTLADGMVGAIEAAAAGEKGAMAQMLADLLKGVAKKNAILALEQAALGAAAIAMYNYPGAAAHFAAAGLHTGVALAAGAGAVAAGSIAADKRAAGGTDNPASASAAFGPGGGGGGSSSAPRGGSSSGGGASGGGGDSGLEAQDVPVSHEQARRGDASLGRPGSGGGHTIIIQANAVVGSGMKDLAQVMRKELDKLDRRGPRPTN